MLYLNNDIERKMLSQDYVEDSSQANKLTNKQSIKADGHWCISAHLEQSNT